MGQSRRLLLIESTLCLPQKQPSVSLGVLSGMDADASSCSRSASTQNFLNLAEKLPDSRRSWKCQSRLYISV